MPGSRRAATGRSPWSCRPGWRCGCSPRSPTARRCSTSTRPSTWSVRGAPRPRVTRSCCGCSIPVGGLALVAAVQHAFGLAMAIAVYALLIRRRVPRWAATLAAAPVLLDGYQLQLEQTVMPDVLFETMIAAGLAAAAVAPAAGTGPAEPPGAGRGGRAGARRHRHRPRDRRGPHRAADGVRRCSTASGWRRRTGRAALATACFVLPVLGYMTAAYLVTGHFGLASNGPAPEYGRAAAAADCATLTVPADERALCPSRRPTLALGGIDGLLHNPRSPGHTVPVPPGTTRAQLLGRLLAGRLPPAAAAGGRVDRQGLRPAVRADQGRRPGDHQHRALAVPDVLPDVPAPVHAGRLHPAGPPARQRR